MGEEYGETAPFQYFTSHSDRDLIQAVRAGRREEFAAFRWQGEPQDPQSESTFAACLLNWDLRRQSRHRELLAFYRELLRLRRTLPALQRIDKSGSHAEIAQGSEVLVLHRDHSRQAVTAVFNLGPKVARFAFPTDLDSWTLLLDSSDVRFGGPGKSLSSTISEPTEEHLRLGEYQMGLFVRA
jgi:maltooligosyltrehalose trehalohydrolase